MIIKAGTLGTWIRKSDSHTARVGARVIVTEDCNTLGDMVRVKWIDDLAGEIGDPTRRQMDGGYFISDFEFDAEPVFDVNKTVEIVAPVSQLCEIIEIGKMLSVMPLIEGDPLYTRPFIQDACYCAYGWTVSETNAVINAAVKLGLFKLV